MLPELLKLLKKTIAVMSMLIKGEMKRIIEENDLKTEDRLGGYL